MGFYKIPPIWIGQTAVIIGSGPSKTQEDADYVRGKARVININRQYEFQPWGDILFAADANEFWQHYGPRGAFQFKGLRLGLGPKCDSADAQKEFFNKYPHVKWLRRARDYGLEGSPDGLAFGYNSGYMAINVAVHFGVRRILLLGFDMKQASNGRLHHHEEYPQHTNGKIKFKVPDFDKNLIPSFDTLITPLGRLGVEVINCSRDTALTCFPRALITEVL